MRLIDADEFMENLIYCDGLGRRGLEAVLKTIKEQPIAYDIEKVVEELDKAESVKTFGSLNSGNRLIPVKDAIDIVRKGGMK